MADARSHTYESTTPTAAVAPAVTPILPTVGAPGSLGVIHPCAPQDFTDLLITLSEAQVEFLAVGGPAGALYGYLRTTNE